MENLTCSMRNLCTLTDCSDCAGAEDYNSTEENTMNSVSVSYNPVLTAPLEEILSV